MNDGSTLGELFACKTERPLSRGAFWCWYWGGFLLFVVLGICLGVISGAMVSDLPRSTAMTVIGVLEFTWSVYYIAVFRALVYRRIWSAGFKSPETLTCMWLFGQIIALISLWLSPEAALLLLFAFVPLIWIPVLCALFVPNRLDWKP